MSEPTTERLTPQQIEGRLTAALITIAASWDDMLVVPPAARPGRRTNGTGVTLDDKAEASDDTPRAVQVIDARAPIAAVLNSWCRVVVQDHDVEHGIPSGTDVPDMARFLSRWAYLMAEHEAAEDLLEEIQAARSVVERWAPPKQHPPAGWRPRPRTMRLGGCPLTWQDPEDAADKPCPGTLRGDEDGWVRCDKCGTAAVMGWWEQQVHGEDGLPLMTLDGVRAYLHRAHGLRLTTRALRAWVERGQLHATDKDDAGRNLYAVEDVEDAMTRRERLPRLA